MSIQRLRELEDEMKKCFRCSLCKTIPLPTITDPAYADGCPAARQYHVHGYSGSGKSIMALSLLEGRIEADKTLAEITYACTACGLCDVSCKFIMDTERHAVNMALREHLVDEGLALSAHRRVIARPGRGGRPGRSRSSVGWARESGLKILPEEKADVLLLAARSDRAANGRMDTNEAMARLLRRSGVDVGIMGGESPDTGLFAYWTGHRDLFVEAAGRLASMIDGLGVREVVVVSGADLGMLRAKYPEYGVDLKTEVYHATEYLQRLIANGRLALPRPVRRTVTYHDPCYLGRQSEPPHKWTGELRMTHGCMTYYHPPKPMNRGVNGVFDPPRRIIESIRGIDFVEMRRIREYAFCCGGGGGVPEAYPRLAGSTALHRVDEARSVGAQCIITACPRCVESLSGAGATAAGKPLPVMDIIDLVSEAAGIET
jgi:Fe-S oxidoreductase